MRHTLAALALGLAVLVPAAAWGTAQPDAAAAASWLADRQTPAGDVPSYTGSGTGELVIALLAGGHPDAADRALGFIDREGAGLASSPAHAARLVIGLTAGGRPARHVDVITDGYDDATGAYEQNVYANALAVIGLAAAGRSVPGRAVTYLKANQCVSGGFAWQAGCARVPDTDTTVMSVSALLASGLPGSDPSVERAVAYLETTRNDDGGWGFEATDATNANSTGLVLSLVAALDPAPSGWRSGAVDALAAFQTPEGGFRHGASGKVNDYATIQAVIGLAGVGYPPGPIARPAAGATSAPSGASPVTAAPGPPAPSGPASSASAAAGDHRAGVVVIGEDGTTRGECVTFSGELTGEALLQRTGFDADVARLPVGSAVCAIDGRGCGTDDCFCQSPAYWGYHVRDAGDPGWTSSEVGVHAREVGDGSVDAYVWAVDGGAPPDDLTLDRVCDAGFAAPSAADAPDVTASGSLAGAIVIVGLVAAALGAIAVALRLRRA